MSAPCDPMVPADLGGESWTWVPEVGTCGPAHTDAVVMFAHARTLALLVSALLLSVLVAQVVVASFRVRGS